MWRCSKHAYNAQQYTVALRNCGLFRQSEITIFMNCRRGDCLEKWLNNVELIENLISINRRSFESDSFICQHERLIVRCISSNLLNYLK